MLQSIIAQNITRSPDSTHFVRHNGLAKIFDCTSIYLSNLAKRYTGYGFCVDIGAPRSVIRIAELKSFLKRIGVRHIPTINSGNSYRFGDVTVASQGIIEIELDTPGIARNSSKYTSNDGNCTSRCPRSTRFRLPRRRATIRRQCH